MHKTGLYPCSHGRTNLETNLGLLSLDILVDDYILRKKEKALGCSNDALEIVREEDKKLKIASFNHQMNCIEYKKIACYEKRPGVPCIEFTLATEPANEKIICWPETQKLFVIKKGYVSAQDIEVGDSFLSIDNMKPLEYSDDFFESKIIKKDYSHTPKFIYSLKVKDNNNFFVNHVLVQEWANAIKIIPMRKRQI